MEYIFSISKKHLADGLKFHFGATKSVHHGFGAVGTYRKKKWKIWNKYLDAPISKIVYKNEYHFFLDSKTEEMTKAILDIFR